jgi:hypothetical protein
MCFPARNLLTAHHVHDVLYGRPTFNNVINSFVFNSVNENIRGSPNCLLELLIIMDGLIKLPSGMFSSAELECLIDYNCTSS